MPTTRLLVARLTRPLRWRSPRATARLLAAFARAERSSYHDLMEAANGADDVGRRAGYLAHAVDEARHGRMFTARALELDPGLGAEPARFRVDFEHLFGRLGEAQFLAFVHLGERRGRAQMGLYCRELAALDGTPRADPRTRALLEAVMADEARHEAYTGEWARALGGSLARARAWELARGWRRSGARLSGALFTILMTLLYLALAPLALLRGLRRRPDKGAR